jgi:hypothetical protein
MSAYVRPKRPNNVRVDDFDRPPDPVPQGQPGVREFAFPPRNPMPKQQDSGSFFHGFDNLHHQAFDRASSGGESTNLTNPKIEHLSFLVKTLAELQFITKGKVGADGSVELMFCSPEPIVAQTTPVPSTVMPTKNEYDTMYSPHRGRSHGGQVRHVSERHRKRRPLLF